MVTEKDKTALRATQGRRAFVMYWGLVAVSVYQLALFAWALYRIDYYADLADLSIPQLVWERISGPNVRAAYSGIYVAAMNRVGEMAQSLFLGVVGLVAARLLFVNRGRNGRILATLDQKTVSPSEVRPGDA